MTPDSFAARASRPGIRLPSLMTLAPQSSAPSTSGRLKTSTNVRQRPKDEVEVGGVAAGGIGGVG
jgi:hypothetical protein